MNGSAELNHGVKPDPAFPVLKEGFPFILIPLAAGLSLLFIPSLILLCATPFLLVYKIAGALLIVFALFCVFFFRNPKIKINEGDGIILSPCNGTVLEIEEKENEKIVRTFLSIFNVHLQRSPTAGTVLSVEHKDGKFLAAWNPEAHILNEQNIITIQTAYGNIVVKQVAGFVARRCVSRVKPGDKLNVGSMIGLIKFSSQVDLHLPPKAAISVRPGDKVRAGISQMGTIN